MSSSLGGYLEKSVVVITTDGRYFTGILQGYDQATNLIIASTQERILSPDSPAEIIDLGLYLIRGDTVVLCGLVDQELESTMDWTKVRGAKLTTTKHAY